jgi:hypothetical protein
VGEDPKEVFTRIASSSLPITAREDCSLEGGQREENRESILKQKLELGKRLS